jgi:3-hydroxyacyl-[acyl-carrier-protein] dehydratase
MPGVLMLEALAQAAALLSFSVADTVPGRQHGVYFAGIDGARFKRPVEPGDQLMLEVDAGPHEGRHLKFKGRRWSATSSPARPS